MSSGQSWPEVVCEKLHELSTEQTFLVKGLKIGTKNFVNLKLRVLSAAIMGRSGD